MIDIRVITQYLVHIRSYGSAKSCTVSLWQQVGKHCLQKLNTRTAQSTLLTSRYKVDIFCMPYRVSRLLMTTKPIDHGDPSWKFYPWLHPDLEIAGQPSTEHFRLHHRGPNANVWSVLVGHDAPRNSQVSVNIYPLRRPRCQASAMNTSKKKQCKLSEGL